MLGNTKDPIAWLHGVTRMEARTIGFVPLLGAMARRCNALLRGHKVTQVELRAHNAPPWWNVEGAPLKPDADTYEYAALAYTTAMTTCCALDFVHAERDIMKVDTLPHSCAGDIYTKVMLVDDL
jgi:hypothetical protein